MAQKYLLLNDIDAYKIAFNLSNRIWQVVMDWNYFAKKTVGEQYVRAIDSVSANIAEGFGRYNKKDKIKFYRYAFGSIKEALDWNEKAKIRKLISKKQYNYIFQELQKLPMLTNQLIKYTNLKLKV